MLYWVCRKNSQSIFFSALPNIPLRIFDCKLDYFQEMADENITASTNSIVSDLQPDGVQAGVKPDSEEGNTLDLSTDSLDTNKSDTNKTEEDKVGNLSPASSEAFTTTTTDERSIIPHIESQSGVKVTEPTSINVGHSKEGRSEPRIHVRWHADIYIDGLGLYQGLVKEISGNGTDIFLDLNLQKVKSINLRIHVPPMINDSEQRFIEVAARVIYSVYDDHESMFHTKVNFTHFNLESDRTYLHSYLQSHILH
jgi:hypothetical protein